MDMETKTTSETNTINMGIVPGKIGNTTDPDMIMQGNLGKIMDTSTNP